MRRAARVDSNHSVLIAAMRQYGAHVIDTSALDGFVDAVVGFRGRTALVEFKRPPGPKGGTAGRNLTPAQEKLHTTWTGGTLARITDTEAAINLLKVMESL